MNAILSAAQLTGLFLFLGGALFRRLLWNAVCSNASASLTQCFRARSGRLMSAGAALFVVTTLAALLFSDRPAVLPGILSAILAPVFVIVFLIAERRDANLLWISSTLVGMSIVGLLAASSHAAAESGVLAPTANIVHWLAALTWGGCALHLALLPWPALDLEFRRSPSPLGELAGRYANIALPALIVIVLTGGLLAFIHVHNVEAMNATQYGLAVKIKAAIVAILLITLTINLLKLGPACRQPIAADKSELHKNPLQRFRRLVRLEAVLLIVLIAGSGILQTRNPPGVPPFINPQTWQITAGEVPLTIQLQPVAGSASRIRIEITSASADSRFPDGSIAEFDLTVAEQNSGARNVEAVSIGPTGFLGETSIPVPGTWHLDLRITYPDQTTVVADYVFEIPAQPLQHDLTAYLSLAAIGFHSANVITFVIGLLLVLTAAWLIRQTRRARAPAWIMPVSLANIVLGGYLVLSVTFVKTYPSTFWSNPAPFTAEVIQRGDVIYREQCAECHGITGKGDGPWALQKRGKAIPDLTAPHMDVHTDGEVYWWITYGIPSLGQPALGAEISENDRWAVINSMRSFRHGIPVQARP